MHCKIPVNGNTQFDKGIIIDFHRSCDVFLTQAKPQPLCFHTTSECSSSENAASGLATNLTLSLLESSSHVSDYFCISFPQLVLFYHSFFTHQSRVTFPLSRCTLSPITLTLVITSLPPY